MGVVDDEVVVSEAWVVWHVVVAGFGDVYINVNIDVYVDAVIARPCCVDWSADFLRAVVTIIFFIAVVVADDDAVGEGSEREKK